MKTEAQYESDICAIAAKWRDLVDARAAAGWAPQLAFEDAANRAAKVGSRDEATIQMMTRAAAWLRYPPSKEPQWSRAAEFATWWNARFSDAPRLDDYDFAAPCLLDVGDGQQVAIIATWSAFTSTLSPERVDA